VTARNFGRLLAVSLVAGVCRAPGQPPGKTPEKPPRATTNSPANHHAIIHVEWTGYYMVAAGKDLAGLQPLNPNLNRVVADHLQPWARARMAASDGVAEDTGAVCLPDGLFRFLPSAGRFLWLPEAAKILLVNDEINTAGVERIYLDREHPKNLAPTFNGDSVGHWEGDTLIVDTVGFNDRSWLQTAMQPHTEQTHMIQRIRSVEAGGNGYLEIDTTIEDRHALTSAYRFTRYYKRSSGEMPELVCGDDVAQWKQWRNKALKPLIERSRVVQ
jgi:hypothetical protein